MNNIKIATSILSADFGRLEEEVLAIDKAGTDSIHIDVMDGHFVPALTFGPVVIQSIRDKTKKPFDIHLMIENPDLYIEDYAKAGADSITVHQECCTHLDRTLSQIKQLGKQAGVALNPSTACDFIPLIIDKVDLILVMTVNPGFAGQKYLSSQEQKIIQIKQYIADRSIDLQVDGGITDQTIKGAYQAGANNFVSGSYVFSGDYQQRISSLKSF